MPEPRFGYVTPENLSLFTDLYELTMLQGYWETGHTPDAVFDLFFRSLPPDRGYLVAAGLEQVLHYLERLEFTDRCIIYLEEQGFEPGFLDWLADFSFTGDVRAVEEGAPVFPDEPVLEVEAPIMQVQLLETMVINQVTFQTLVATKAARMRDVVEANGDAALVDFGSRRAHGTDAGMKAARASYLAGFAGTSNVAAGEAFSIPVFGTMAHSWVQSFGTEREAFEAYVDVYGEESILLIDTYDTLQGARTAKQVAQEKGPVRGVRIDSGDLPALAQQVKEETGMDVFVSSGLDEYALQRFYRDGGEAAGFGVGTNLVTSADAPTLEGVYKLVAVERGGTMQPSMKLSRGKVTYPGRKQVYRRTEGGTYTEDTLARSGEDAAGDLLLHPVIQDGDRVTDLPDLDTLRERAIAEHRKIPKDVRRIEDPATYPVRVSDGLEETTEKLRARLAQDV